MKTLLSRVFFGTVYSISTDSTDSTDSADNSTKRSELWKQSEYSEYSEYSKRLKCLAKQLYIPIEVVISEVRLFIDGVNIDTGEIAQAGTPVAHL